MKKIAAVVLAALLLSAAAIPSFAESHVGEASPTEPFMSFEFQRYARETSGGFLPINLPHDYLLFAYRGNSTLYNVVNGSPASGLASTAPIGQPIKDSTLFDTNEKYHFLVNYSGGSHIGVYSPVNLYYTFNTLPSDAVVSSFSTTVMVPEFSNYSPWLPYDMPTGSVSVSTDTIAFVTTLNKSGEKDIIQLNPIMSGLVTQTVAGYTYNIWTLRYDLKEPILVSDVRFVVPVWWYWLNNRSQEFWFAVSNPVVEYSLPGTDIVIGKIDDAADKISGSISDAADKQLDYLDQVPSEYELKQQEADDKRLQLQDKIDQLAAIDQYEADASNLDFSLLQGSEFQKNSNLFRRAFDSMPIFVTVPIIMSLGIVSLVIFGKKA